MNVVPLKLAEANVGAAGQRNLWAGYELAAAGGGS